MITTYRLLLLLKFAGVLVYAGGLIAAFATTAAQDRRRAVHAIASPGLLATWLAGYSLSHLIGVPLSQLWIVGALALSLASQLLLVRSLHWPPTFFTFAGAATPLLAVLVLMIFRPVWP